MWMTDKCLQYAKGVHELWDCEGLIPGRLTSLTDSKAPKCAINAFRKIVTKDWSQRPLGFL